MVTNNIEFVKYHTLDNIKDTEIKKSLIHGFGLFCTNIIQKGEVLAELDGQIINKEEYEKLMKSISPNIQKYKDYFFMECNIIDDETYLVRAFRTKYSYINHSKNANIKLLQNPLRLLAISQINKGEELTIDYSKEKLSEEYLKNETKQFIYS